MVVRKYVSVSIVVAAIYTCTSLASCESPATEQDIEKRATLTGEQIYKQNCTSCHGPKGDLGISGAANLQISIKSTQEKIDFIANGSSDGMMAAYGKSNGGVLSKTEIKKVADFIGGFSE